LEKKLVYILLGLVRFKRKKESFFIIINFVGLYTTWLFPASLVGLLVFLFGFIYLADNIPANDVCTIGQNITMCPICDEVNSKDLIEVTTTR
jgi:hypothetical protein